MCNCVMSGCISNSACIYSTEYTYATRNDKNQGNCLWRLYWISYWTSVLAKRRAMLATFWQFLAVCTYRMQSCPHQYWHIVGCPISFANWQISLKLAFCILPVAKTYFSKRIHKSRIAILTCRYISNPRVHTNLGLLSTCLSNAWSRMIGDICKFSPPRCIFARTFVERALCVSKVYPY